MTKQTSNLEQNLLTKPNHDYSDVDDEHTGSSSASNSSTLTKASFLKNHNRRLFAEICGAMVHYMDGAKASKMTENVVKLNIPRRANNYNKLKDVQHRHFFSEVVRHMAL